MERRAVAVIALLFCTSSPALAQSGEPARYPTRPVRIVVPFGAGGPSDLLARTVAQKMSESLGQQVITENRGGANGVVGVEAVARSAPDGYTLVLGTTGTHGINASLVPRLSYDTIKDFAPIARLGISNYVLVAHPSLPVRTVKELLQLAKARPGELTWAAGGGVTQLAAELFKHSAGINVIIVPYKGNAPAVTATMSGEVSLIFGGIAQAAKLVEAGRLRAIAVSGAHRSPTLPSVPTVAESGLPGFEAGSWYGLLAPGKTSGAIVSRLNRELRDVLADPDTRQRFLQRGIDPMPDSSQEFGALIRSEIAKWAKVIRAAGIKPE